MENIHTKTRNIYRKNYNNNKKNKNNKKDKKECKNNKKNHKKIVKKTNTNSMLGEDHSIVKGSERVKIVLKATNGCCEYCGKKIKNVDYSNIYAIESREVDKDSILNMVVLCGNCINKVSFRSDDEDVKNKLKKIAEKRLDNMEI